jgi:hypothetical protein
LKEDEMKRTLITIMLIAMLGLVACSTAKSGIAPAARSAATASGEFALGGAAPAPPQSVSPSTDLSKSGNQSTSSPDRLVIQNAELSIVVKDVNAEVTALQAMAKAMGGFVVSVNVFQTTAPDGTPVPQAQVVVRVPAASLDDVLNQVKQDAVDVKNETRSGQDVTDQYVDLQSRLTAKQAAETQLLSIMQKATKTEDVLAVYAQLQQVQSDIEVLKGQIKYTEQSAALSALSVSIVAEKTVKPIEVGGWKPQGVARDALQSLIFFWQDFVDFMIRFVLLILPILITIAIPFYLAFLVLRWIFRKLRKPRAKPQPEETKK